MRAICEEVLQYVATSSYSSRRNEQSAAACLLSSRLASLRLPGPVPCARCRFDLTSQENLSVSLFSLERNDLDHVVQTAGRNHLGSPAPAASFHEHGVERTEQEEIRPSLHPLPN